jgi:hypothetical protein
VESCEEESRGVNGACDPWAYGSPSVRLLGLVVGPRAIPRIEIPFWACCVVWFDATDRLIGSFAGRARPTESNTTGPGANCRRLRLATARRTRLDPDPAITRLSFLLPRASSSSPAIARLRAGRFLLESVIRTQRADGSLCFHFAKSYVLACGMDYPLGRFSCRFVSLVAECWLI